MRRELHFSTLLKDLQQPGSEKTRKQTGGMGILSNFKQQKLAKWLMPLVSEDTRQKAIMKLKEEAKEKGYAFPTALESGWFAC